MVKEQGALPIAVLKVRNKVELEKGAVERKRGPRGSESVPVFGDRSYHDPPRPYSGTMNK